MSDTRDRIPTGRRRGRYRGADRLVMGYLASHPDVTAWEIAEATGLPEATVRFELAKYQSGAHEEPRYEMSGYGKRTDGRPAQLWRLAAEPESSARRRLRAAAERISRILSKHPQLAGEAVSGVMKAANHAARRVQRKSKKG